MNNFSTSRSVDGNDGALLRRANNDPGRRELAGWKAIGTIVAFAPVLHLLATWDRDGGLTQMNHWFRLYSIPVIALEVIMLIFALFLGWSPTSQFNQLPSVVKYLLITAFVMVGLSTFVASVDPTTSFLFASKYLLQILTGAALVFLISSDKNFSLNYWLGAVLTGSILYVTLITIFCLTVIKPADFQWVERIPSATNIRQIGNVMGLMALSSATLVIVGRSRRSEAIGLITTTFLLTFVAWSGTRTALLAFLLALTLSLAITGMTVQRKKILLLISSAVAAGLISVCIPNPTPEFGLIRIASSLGSEDISSGRAKMWLDALHAISTSPWIGHGAGTYRENMYILNGYPYNHPHNFILQFVYDWGLLGGGVVLGLLAWLGLRLIHTSRDNGAAGFLALSAYLSILAMGFIEGTLFHPLPMLLAIALICPHLSRSQSAKGSNERTQNRQN